VTVWNVTRRCNLRCVHCYTDSENIRYANELTTEEGKAFLRDLADFKVPAILF
jgi:MoaA/NifB/PqqE/SkfB family radical SAM enzyme